MELTGLTNGSEDHLNIAILNLARKLKMERSAFWQIANSLAGREITNLNQLTVAKRVDWLIGLGYNLYKR